MSEKKSEVFEQVADIVKMGEESRRNAENFAINLMDNHFKFYEYMNRQQWDEWKARNYPNYKPFIK